jgi:hypothetical protein
MEGGNAESLTLSDGMYGFKYSCEWCEGMKFGRLSFASQHAVPFSDWLLLLFLGQNNI